MRPAVQEDGALLVSLRRAWTDEQHQATIDDEDFDARLLRWRDREQDRRRFWLAFAGQIGVGMINLAVFERMPRPGQHSAQWGYVGTAFVLEEFRNLGVGSRLVDAVVTYAGNEGFVRLVLSPSERSTTLYARAGFRPASELMVLPLKVTAQT